MKKIVLLFSAVVLFAGLTFGQTPQKQDKVAKPAEKTEKVTKDSKSGCDEKTKAACGEAKKGSSCCPSSAKKSCTDTKTPIKK
ncbi:MAG: hypothetical protein NT004_18525 [Bacteroidetes bacterium]|nr:hypothetical protein [Bacteroidota bacterium]